MRIQAISEVEIAAIAKWEYPDELSTYNHEEIELGNDSFFQSTTKEFSLDSELVESTQLFKGLNKMPVTFHIAKSAGFSEVKTITNSTGEFIILQTLTSELKV